MGKISIRKIGETPTSSFPDTPGVGSAGYIVSQALISSATSASNSLSLWQHTLQAGAAFHFDAPPVDHAFYVVSGTAQTDGKNLDCECVAVIEHGANASLQAIDGPVTFLHFFSDPDRGRPSRPGGNVHVHGNTGLFQAASPRYEASAILWADSGCKNCELWLHKSTFGKSVHGVGLHYHTEDEIIYVVQGELLLGRQVLPPGTAIAVERGTRYRFEVGPEGLQFLNFRSVDPSSVGVLDDGTEVPPLSERQYWNDAHAKATAKVGVMP